MVITLRNFPPDIARAILRTAKERGISLNKAVVGLLEEGIRGKRSGRARRYRDLDFLAGAWSAEEAKTIEKHLKMQRAIDEELWK